MLSRDDFLTSDFLITQHYYNIITLAYVISFFYTFIYIFSCTCKQDIGYRYLTIKRTPELCEGT